MIENPSPIAVMGWSQIPRCDHAWIEKWTKGAHGFQERLIACEKCGRPYTADVWTK